MSISPQLLLRLLLGLALAGAIASLAVKQSEVGRLRAEQASLASDSQEATRLAEENKGIDTLRAANGEGEKLRAENQELPRLRNDVRQLRRQAEAVEKLRAENQRLQTVISAARSAPASGALPPGFIARAAMQDAGSATPEAAVQTFFWAMSRGDLDRLSQLAVGGPANSGADQERQQRDMIEGMSSFPGFGIADKKIKSPDEVEIDLQTASGATIVPMKLKRVDNEWKLDVR